MRVKIPLKEKKKRLPFLSKIIPKSRIVKGLLLIVLLSLLVTPFLPKIKLYMYRFFNPEAFTTEYYLEKYTPDEEGTEDEESFRLKLDNEVSDRVIIPKIGAEIEIFRNMDEKQALSQGSWVVPGSVKAEEDGEIYITGHRFAVVPPAKNTFYNLDQLGVGDEFFLIEGGYLHKYTVEGTEVVDPQEVSFDENLVEGNKVVLYTCTPLWTSAKRLLVKSEQTYF